MSRCRQQKHSRQGKTQRCPPTVRHRHLEVPRNVKQGEQCDQNNKRNHGYLAQCKFAGLLADEIGQRCESKAFLTASLELIGRNLSGQVKTYLLTWLQATQRKVRLRRQT